MEIFPHILTRIGGGSFNNLNGLISKSLAQKSEQIAALHQTKEISKIALTEELFLFIRTLCDNKSQNLLQNIRRDIYNDRVIKSRFYDEAQGCLPLHLMSKLDRYISLLKEINDFHIEAQRIYNIEVDRTRRHLQELSKDQNLQKGLILSSQVLLKCLLRYQQKETQSFGKKEYQIENGILKYLTRMYSKTSPFSTFNSLVLGRLEKNEPGAAVNGPEYKGQSKVAKSHIRLNNGLFKYLKALFFSSQAIYEKLLVTPNPTIIHKKDHFSFLTNHNNIEAFQRVPDNDVLLLVFRIFREYDEGIRVKSLIKEMRIYIDASETDLKIYVQKLIQSGFLEYNLGVSGIDPDWDLRLVEKLELLIDENIPHVSELIDCLKLLRLIATKYAVSGVESRLSLLNQAYTSFRNICMLLHEDAGLPEIERKSAEEISAFRKTSEKERIDKAHLKVKGEQLGQDDGEDTFLHRSSTFFYFKPEHIFYEDSVLDISIQLNSDKVSGLVKKLHSLLQEMDLFKVFAEEKQEMKEFFFHKYEKSSVIPFLTFYEDYYRYIKPIKSARYAKQQGKAIDPTNNNHQVSVENGKRQNKIKAWYETCESMILPKLTISGDEVSICLTDIQPINHALGTTPFSSSNSYGALVQFYEDLNTAGKAVLKGVLNSTFPGFGKMLSRFVSMFPSEFAEDIRIRNIGLVKNNTLFVENCDASYFNANMHPPLIPYEILVPGGHNSLPSSEQLPISDFEIKYDVADGQLILVHKPTLKRAYLFDLGFQALLGRSPLFQLLQKFSKAEYLSAQPLVKAINSCINKFGDKYDFTRNKSIKVLPRIVFEEQIILQRKQWQIPKELLPLREPKNTDCEYFLKINAWRRELQIPDEVFVFVRAERGNGNGNGVKTGRDDYKPQYIDFRSPVLVSLFERLVIKVSTMFKIEEMLPASSHLASIGNERFVTECTLQWYT